MSFVSGAFSRQGQRRGPGGGDPFVEVPDDGEGCRFGEGVRIRVYEMACD